MHCKLYTREQLQEKSCDYIYDVIYRSDLFRNVYNAGFQLFSYQIIYKFHALTNNRELSMRTFFLILNKGA